MKRTLSITVLFFILILPVYTEDTMDKTNRLILEKSPYLLQHAHNPVDWYPWGEEAFQKAREENKPIFLSIGYSTCHWCHVMERESFEDEEVAALMNRVFISIKVDREERPDIDEVYMTVAQILTGRGGWPLTIFMTPDKLPFFAGTYIPKHGRGRSSGMMELIPAVEEIWLTRQDDILKSATEITQALEKTNTTRHSDTLVGLDQFRSAARKLIDSHDAEYGGFGSSPKFPTSHNLLLLLRYWKETGDNDALKSVETTLEHMRLGGIWDHIGFGFHRYSTDREWLVPHFEKMLYDQAMLVIAYAESYQATGNMQYARTAREILSYVLRDMRDPAGSFYSAEDADSDGEEGLFYLWTQEEIAGILDDDTEWFTSQFGISSEGNFRDEATGVVSGRNIPHLASYLSSDDGKTWERVRQLLFDAREVRQHPLKDDKILTDWNGLMIYALAKAGRALADLEYINAAEKSAAFILNTMSHPDGRLYHRSRGGESGLAATLDDYAFLVFGLIELYQTTHAEKWLAESIRLTGIMIEDFLDETNGGFYLTADEGERLLIRPKTAYDGAIPSGNSVAASNLERLYKLTGDIQYEVHLNNLSRAFFTSVHE